MSSGNGAFFQASCSSPKQSSLLVSHRQNGNIYFSSRKRICVTTSFPSIEILPDECLFEVFRRLSNGQERSASACVSKRWLMLLSSIRKDDIAESNGYLARSLVGRKATDVTLDAIAVGTANLGGLAKLSIQGNNFYRGVTDVGLKVIARGCPTLRELSLGNVSSVGDEGLSEIAHGCHLLEKLDLYQCPRITDKSLLDIATNCPNLNSLSINDCSYIGNESLKAVGKYCPNLKLVGFKNCPLIGDQGIADLFYSAGHILTRVKLEELNINDISLDIISHHGIALTQLLLADLQGVEERGFWVLGISQRLPKLKALLISAYYGVNNLGLQVICKGCPDLKMICIQKSGVLTDYGLVACVKALVSLQRIQLEECHLITQAGLYGILLNCGNKLKHLSLAKCFGLKNFDYSFPSVAPCCYSLVSVAIQNCPGVGNATIAVLGRLCQNLTHLVLNGLLRITDEGLISFVQSCKSNLMAVNLSGCINITDGSVSALVVLHGESLRSLIVHGCRHVTDATLVEIANFCLVITKLDISNCGITDSGIRSLANAIQLQLRIFSLSGCSLVSDNSLPYLHELFEYLQILNIQHCVRISSRTVNELVENHRGCNILS